MNCDAILQNLNITVDIPTLTWKGYWWQLGEHCCLKFGSSSHFMPDVIIVEALASYMRPDCLTDAFDILLQWSHDVKNRDNYLVKLHRQNYRAWTL